LDGTILNLGSDDHGVITRIDNMTINRFLSLGNIRMSQNSFQLIKQPTREQELILQKIQNLQFYTRNDGFCLKIFLLTNLHLLMCGNFEQNVKVILLKFFLC
jgi:hypothetical protein